MDVLQEKPASRLTSWRAAATGTGPQGSQPVPSTSPVLSELVLARLMSESALSNFPELALSRSVALLLVLRPEATQVAALAAICASAANALHFAPDLRAARALTQFYPIGSANFILASTRYRRVDQSRRVSDALDAFNEALASAMKETMDYTARRQGGVSLSAVSRDELAQWWRSVCAAAHTLLSAIDAAISMFNPVSRADESDLLMRALKDAANGGSPMRTPGGGYEMPYWEEQRRSPRLAVSCFASVMVGTRLSTARITDVSTGGVGIEMTEQLAEGENVVIKVGLIIMAGTVVWRRMPRAGIAFAQSLVDDPPNYKFLSSHAERD